MTARLGGRVKRLRDERGWSQAELARMVGVTQGQIAKIEGGGRGTTLETAERLADAFGVSVDELLARVPGRPGGIASDAATLAAIRALIERPGQVARHRVRLARRATDNSASREQARARTRPGWRALAVPA